MEDLISQKADLKPIPIVILNWNGLEDTVECMTSVLKLELVPFEVYLIDNASSQPNEVQTLVDLYGHYDHIHIIRNKTNLGFTRGCNEIMKELVQKEAYDYIVLLNNDTVVTPLWLYHLVKSSYDNQADMVSSKMINYYDRSIMDNAGHFMLNTAEILPLGHAKDVNDFNDLKQNIGACGGAALYSIKMIKDIGYFDEFFNTGYEDAEFGLRANKAGYLSIFEPKAKIYHKVSRSILKIKDDKYITKIQRNIFYTYIKLLPNHYILKNLPFIVLKYLFLFLGSILIFNFRVIKIHFKTIFHFLSNDRKIALEKKGYMKRANHIFNHSFLQRIKFFLRTDINRFYNLLWR